MFDPNQINDDERELLEQIARSKGQTMEEALADFGHKLPSETDESVTLEGETDPEEKVQPAPDPGPAPGASFAAAEPETRAAVQDDSTQLYEQLQYEVTPEVEPPPPPEAEEDPEEPAAAAKEEATEEPASTGNQICVQCGWNQDVPVVPEPDGQDKIAFLQSILGHKTFSKRYKLFGGQLTATFRTLTIREIDALYESTFEAQKAGVILTSSDYYEYLNRLRVHLQLISLVSPSSSLHIKLPEGLSEAAHPTAPSHWDTFLRDKELYQQERPLVSQVQDYVIDQVLKIEQLQRTITHECAKFNRLVAKMEACVDSPDFWNETKPQS